MHLCAQLVSEGLPSWWCYPTNSKAVLPLEALACAGKQPGRLPCRIPLCALPGAAVPQLTCLTAFPEAACAPAAGGTPSLQDITDKLLERLRRLESTLGAQAVVSRIMRKSLTDKGITPTAEAVEGSLLDPATPEEAAAVQAACVLGQATEADMQALRLQIKALRNRLGISEVEVAGLKALAAGLQADMLRKVWVCMRLQLSWPAGLTSSSMPGCNWPLFNRAIRSAQCAHRASQLQALMACTTIP